jgi:hypothetical protein
MFGCKKYNSLLFWNVSTANTYLARLSCFVLLHDATLMLSLRARTNKYLQLCTLPLRNMLPRVPRILNV